MRRLLAVILISGLVGASAATAQTPLRFATQPTLSPDGSEVAFVWLDDLWVGSTAGGPIRPLTTHPAMEGRPQWSPDGQWIAFISYREGSWDAYVMPAAGGEPKRLTFHGGAETVRGWTPDSQGIVFGSRRALASPGPERQDYVVGLDGGPWRRLMAVPTLGSWYSPDSTRVAFVRGGSTGVRRGYDGPAAEDIWVHTLGSDTYTQLTDFAGPDTSPQWLSDDEVLFVSERSGVHNLWRQRLDGAAEQVTSHDWMVYNPAVSADRQWVVYESGHDLWRLRLAGGEPERLALTAPADRAEPRQLWRTQRDGAGEYAVSPDGAEVAFVVRGDIYVARFPDGGPTARLTDTPATEGGLSWSKDSRHLYYHSDRDGQHDLYSIASGDEHDKRLRRALRPVETRRTYTAGHERNPIVSPDGKLICFVAGRGDLTVAPLAEDGSIGAPRVIAPSWSFPNAVWAPDSHWLAYSRPDEFDNQDIFLVEATGGESINVSVHPTWDWGPTFAGDGSKLGFLSRREGGQGDAYFVWLTAAEWERSAADRADEEDDKAARPKPPPAPEPPPAAPAGDEPADADTDAAAEAVPAAEAAPAQSPAEPAAKRLTIDFDGLTERIVRLTSSADDELNLVASPDGQQFAYTTTFAGQRDLQVIKFDGTGARRLTTGVAPVRIEWSPDGRSLRYVRGGQVHSVPAGGGAIKTVAHEALISRDLAAERAYIFDTVWRTIHDDYYDPTWHGVDWPALRERYAPIAAEAPSEADFDGVVNELLGELRSSHTGYSHSRPSTPGVLAGELGVVWAADGQTVERVYLGSPAALSASRLSPGDQITSVDDQPLEGRSVDELLLGTAGRRVRLLVVDAEGKHREVVLRPLSAGALGERQYQDWLEARRKLVAELSDGRVGYLHIRAMDDASLTEFERQIFAAGSGKEALLIDVRYNGGGSTADYVLGMIGARSHAFTIPRDGPQGYPYGRLYAPLYPGPVALLINQYSVSNAEILAHAFNTLELGPTIGWPTNGGVISTGSRTLLDGSTMRLPLRGWYRQGDGANMEGTPATPTIAVAQTPADEAAGRDPQLEAAVAAVLGGG